MAFSAGERIVFVLGAGFTRALVPNAPLLIDDYGIAELIERFASFPRAAQLLDRERARYSDGRVDIERLWTRLDMLMPHDVDSGAAPELQLLLSETKQAFLQRLVHARSGANDTASFQGFASFCVSRGVDCVTFNYDDFLDEHLWLLSGSDQASSAPYWHPDGGYGFYCQPAVALLGGSADRHMDSTAMHLYKLHGSTNWRIRRGADEPFAIGEIVHHENWIRLLSNSGWSPTASQTESHLEQLPLIVPPVLTKTQLTTQPILRMVWSQARETLLRAQRAVFIGYSLPVTDIAASFLFQESLYLMPNENIHVVNFATSDRTRREIVEAYERQLGPIPSSNFYFDGAKDWITRELP